MNARAYCRAVELKDKAHKQLEPNFWIIDNGEALISLQGVDFKLIYEPSIMQDYRYLIREGLLPKIERISHSLQLEDKTLVIRSAWRSFEHQRALFDGCFTRIRKEFPKKNQEEIHHLVSNFVAPFNKSTHATGGAIDALILDNKTNTILNFGTNDGLEIHLNQKCYPLHPDISEEAKENRALLMGLFQNEGFVCDLKEFWHFDYGNVGWAIETGRDCALYDIIESRQSDIRAKPSHPLQST